ncbi:MAG: hypothetical protein LBF40_06415 [Deltaproteobacteria bacterium]|jgi:hypothetical protein|nr:hypothetical protein [Deltaproteobacteria bacterium]
MQLDNRNTYNTLGRVGPLYPRPEYRPPVKDPSGEGVSKDGSVKDGPGAKKAPSDSLILSDNLKRKNLAPKADPQAKLNLQLAKDLVSESAQGIKNLEPSATDGCPHGAITGEGLLYPTYA